MPVTLVKSDWTSGNLRFRQRLYGTDNSAVYFGEDDQGLDVKFFGATSGAYMLWDESADDLILAGGAALVPSGEFRLDFSSCTVAAANTDGGIIKAGTSSSPVTEDTANMKFMSFYFDDGATSGDARGMYLRLYITGAGGGGEAARVFTTVSNVAGANAHGQHTSLSFGTSGTLTGQGIASRNTLHIPNVQWSSNNVTYSALQAEIWADGATTDPQATNLSFIRVVAGGTQAGIDDIEDDAFMFAFNGFTAASGNVIGGNTSDECQLNFTNWVPIRIQIGSTTHYLVAAQTVAAVSSG